ncbi:phage tail protein I [Pseudomonas sp. 5P_3.1_Bac2]|uniref:phage tail protein I n=1 Tax=Pseudomonas sp. 5P_3.1_Bac2 TaxID=2971617 RepID=UPI0021C8A09A|nr:phage tail protein I [Pseudomonas sp. 5P_3.1_Bac2]MCU1717429.1 phage tail protein I [Pseudomonas sp. 5P_3.1_Bac2]
MSNSPSLLPSNSTPLERTLEQATARLGELPVPLRELWNPDTCPEELLPWLAWSLSLDSWQPYWPLAVKRARIKAAVDIQRHKGTAQSVRDAVASFGSALALREWWQTTPRGTPHTFEVVLTLGSGVPNTQEYQLDIIKEIEATKPVRSHFTLTVGQTALTGLGLQGAARPVSYLRLQLNEAP